MLQEKLISWEQLDGDLKSLTQKLKHLQIDNILAIALGGVTPASYLAHHLSSDRNKHLPVDYALVELYQAPGERFSQVKVHNITRTNFGRVLIVDDVYETGKSVEAVRDMIVADSIEVAFVYNKSAVCPPYFHYSRCLDINLWWTFPWEPSQNS